MDDATQPNTPENDTEPLNDPKYADPYDLNDDKYADELDLTQPSLAQFERFEQDQLSKETRRREVSRVEKPQQSSEQYTQFASTAKPAQHWSAPPPPSMSYMPPAAPQRITVSTARANWTWVVLAGAALSITLIIGLIGFLGIRYVSASRNNNLTVTPDFEGTMVASAETPMPTFMSATATIGIEIEPWDGTERFTILLMGLDKRPGERGTAFRTDSMILVSIDPTTKSIGMLSIPRDLYIELPPDTIVTNSYGLQRVNSAYVIGELVQPGYGPKLAMQTVQYNLGMRIHDYIVFDFSTVIDVIDTVGGVDIDVAFTINDPQYPNMYYGYEPLYIPAGRTHMDGQLALKYARSRHQTSDFDRAKRQQQVITALRDKVLDLNMLPELLVNAPGLWNRLSVNVKTGLTLDQLLRLAVYVKDIPKENIHQGVLDTNYVTPTMWNGAAVLVPNRTSIGPLLVQIFGANYNQ
jgi:polyisoprenyl-teichoic acid--peptidoglycan teichoic acid transferase